MFDAVVTTSMASPAPASSSQHWHFDMYNACPDLPHTDACLITIPFSRRLTDPYRYARAIQQLCDRLPDYPLIIFTSSTSVYTMTNDWVNEDSPIADHDRARALHEAETHLMRRFDRGFVLRLGGICGGTRSSQSKINQTVIVGGHCPVNLIHINDITRIIWGVMGTPTSGHDVINVCCDDHPTKAAYYRYVCDYLGCPLPAVSPEPRAFKQVCNQKLRTTYKLELMFPSPLMFSFQ